MKCFEILISRIIKNALISLKTHVNKVSMPLTPYSERTLYIDTRTIFKAKQYLSEA